MIYFTADTHFGHENVIRFAVVPSPAPQRDGQSFDCKLEQPCKG